MTSLVPRSFVWATDIDVLAVDRAVERRGDHLVVRSPSNPAFWWGNLLVFDDPPQSGDRTRWEAAFERAFAGEPRVRHRTFAWDRTDGALGAAGEEFSGNGYRREAQAGLTARPADITPHPRANRDVTVRTLDPDGDARAWAAMLAIEQTDRPEHVPAADHEAFLRARTAERCERFRRGEGAWYVAQTPDGEVTAGLGIIVTGGRGRFQAVITAPAHRGLGICSRLVVEAAADATRTFGAERLVIVADPDYHALGLYESLGFTQAERVYGVFRPPGAETRG